MSGQVFDTARVVKEAIKGITKKFGTGVARSLVDTTISSEVRSWISTRDPALDAVIGRGVPVGRMTEIFGPEANGKSTLALAILAETQRIGGIGALFDTESVADPVRCAALGVDRENLIYFDPASMEATLNHILFLIGDIRSVAPDIPLTVVWDSIAGTPTQSELDGEVGKQQYAAAARILSLALRKLVGVISKQQVCMIFVNQIRAKIGLTYGNMYDTYGGKAMKFYCSVRLALKKKEILYRVKTEPPYGIVTEVKTEKNKVAAPFRRANITIRFDTGIDPWPSYLNLALQFGLVTQAGAWLDYGGAKFQRAAWPEFCINNPGLLEAIQKMVYG